MRKLILSGVMALLLCPCLSKAGMMSWSYAAKKKFIAPAVVAPKPADPNQLYCHARTGSCYKIATPGGKQMPFDYAVKDCSECKQIKR